MGGVNKWDEAGDAVRSVIRAYHGSPHDFDKFDASKIGAGTGRQSYGHGLYFSSSEPMADTYRSGASALHRTPEEDALELWRRHSEKQNDPKRGILDAIDSASESMQAAEGMWMAQQRWDDILQHLYGIDYRQPLPKRSGTMFEVELGFPRQALLDYDNPFRTPAGATAARVLDRASPGIIDPKTLKSIQDSAERGDRLTVHGDNGERGMAAMRMRRFAQSPEGAKALLDEGIPGVEYVDDSMISSKGIDPAVNYVAFPGTEDSIRILRKYAIPGAVGTGVASQYEESP